MRVISLGKVIITDENGIEFYNTTIECEKGKAPTEEAIAELLREHLLCIIRDIVFAEGTAIKPPVGGTLYN